MKFEKILLLLLLLLLVNSLLILYESYSYPFSSFFSYYVSTNLLGQFSNYPLIKSDIYLYYFRSIFQDIVSMDTVIMKIMVCLLYL